MARQGFQQVGEHDVPDAEVIEHPAQRENPRSREQTELASQALLLALKALSQRALVAASTLFTAAGLLGGYMLWSSILTAPTTNQLVGVSLYAVFFVALEIVRRR